MASSTRVRGSCPVRALVNIAASLMSGKRPAILLGNYKLMRIYETGERRFFDLSKDIGKRNNLAKQMPDKVADLDRRLTDYLTAVDAQMPTINANIPAGQVPPDAKRGKSGKGGKGGKRGGADATPQPKQ